MPTRNITSIPCKQSIHTLIHTFQTHYGYGTVGFSVAVRRFYGSDDATNSITELKDNSQSSRSRANPTRLRLLKDIVKNITIKQHNDQIYGYRGNLKTES